MKVKAVRFDELPQPKKPLFGQGVEWSAKVVQDIWEKGTAIEGLSPLLFRKDALGNILQRDQYGNRNHQFGWEVDHIHPKSKGGSDAPENLQPLWWRANVIKSNKT